MPGKLCGFKQGLFAPRLAESRRQTHLAGVMKGSGLQVQLLAGSYNSNDAGGVLVGLPCLL